MRKCLIAAGAGLLLFASSANADMLVQYLFSEGSGSSAANTGTAGATGNLTLAGSPAPVFSLAGFTPSGAGHSLDNTASPAAGSGGYAQTAASFDVLDNLSQVTLTGWFNTQSAASLQRLIDRADNAVGSDQWSLYFDGNTSKLQLNLGSTVYVSNDVFGALDTWTFFAVVINENDGGNRIKFYAGDVATAAAAAGNLSSTSSELGNNSKKLTIGNRESGSRAFDGYLWDVRIYDEALSDTAVETVRASAIPEPAMLGLSLLPTTLLLRRRVRH